MSRMLRTILILSLALNLALGAGLGWWAWQSHRFQNSASMRDGRPILFRPDALRGTLRADRSALVDRVMAHHRDRMGTQIQALRAARDEVREAMLAEPFQRERLDAAFAQLRDTETRTATEAHALLSDLVEQAEPRERQRMARLVQDHRGRHPAMPMRERQP